MKLKSGNHRLYSHDGFHASNFGVDRDHSEHLAPVNSIRNEHNGMARLRWIACGLFLTLALSFEAAAVHADESVPVMVGGEAELDACGGVGEVRGLNPRGDGFLAVRAGPGGKFPMIDRLYNGNRVYFCDKRGDWIGIVYGDPKQDCGVASPLPKRQSYKGPCQSGWAYRKWLVLIAG